MNPNLHTMQLYMVFFFILSTKGLPELDLGDVLWRLIGDPGAEAAEYGPTYNMIFNCVLVCIFIFFFRCLI